MQPSTVALGSPAECPKCAFQGAQGFGLGYLFTEWLLSRQLLSLHRVTKSSAKLRASLSLSLSSLSCCKGGSQREWARLSLVSGRSLGAELFSFGGFWLWDSQI